MSYAIVAHDSYSAIDLPASPVSKSPVLSDIEGKHVKITGRIEIYQGKPEIRINAASQLESSEIGSAIGSEYNPKVSLTRVHERQEASYLGSAADPPTSTEMKLIRLLTENRLSEAKALIHEVTSTETPIKAAEELIIPTVRAIENELFPARLTREQSLGFMNRCEN
jgi:hypothetical protein